MALLRAAGRRLRGQRRGAGGGTGQGARGRWRVFCDLDGVLADFEKAVKRVTGRSVAEQDPRQMWPALAKVDDFFNRLDWMPEGRELWAHLLPHSPTVLTGLPRGSWAAPQKRAWCSRELGPSVPVITCLRRDKPQYGGRGSVLIDDTRANCADWVAAGGVFILHTAADSSIREFNEVLSSPPPALPQLPQSRG
eukprot:TRINITY_DN26121_c0_g1_i1.p3 TRINITY_DN26121_c0_g1~~TRINITY_DN26121_c0_g1_i1.p3  ORF type:complete len:221 (+),score=64.50 TRINITY_DN26121_c0_g1_i1:82-663(+)